MDFQIDIKAFITFTLVFIIFTAIGTLSHEYAHIIAAQSLGYDTTLHYNSMNYDSGPLKTRLWELYAEHQNAIDNNLYFKERSLYETGIRTLKTNRLLISASGPLQTILVGTIGFIFLVKRRKDKTSPFTLGDWVLVFLSFFWLREIFNLLMSIGGEIISPNGSWFSGDEKLISEMLHLFPGTLPIALGSIGFCIVLITIFKYVPKPLSLTLIMGGFVGGILGFVLWMQIIGPKLLP